MGLSYLEINSSKEKKEDYLVLNSLVNLNKAIRVMGKYQEVKLFLDHDPAGRKTTECLLNELSNFRDGSSFYSSCKDLNDYYMNLIY